MKYLVLSLLFVSSTSVGAMDYTEREEVKAFVKELAAAESFDEKELLSSYVDRFIRLSDGRLDSEENVESASKNESALL